MTCLAPALPMTPGSFGFGLRSLPRFLFKNPSILLLPPVLSNFDELVIPESVAAGAVWSARPDQLPVSSSTICTPPPLLTLRTAGFGLCGGIGRLKDFEADAGLGEFGAFGNVDLRSSKAGKVSPFPARTGDMSIRRGGDPSGEAGDDRVTPECAEEGEVRS